MAYQIIYKKRFTQKILQLLDYQQKEWGRKVADNFVDKLYQRLSTLSKQPYIGTPSTKVESVHSILITKHNRLFYRIKGNKIAVINMYGTRSNPKKNMYQ